jgi:uncharacterized protein YggT (Ycf19 family)
MARESTAHGVGPVYRVSKVLILFVYAFATACVIILATAFFLQLFNASTSAPFVRWVYRASTRIMEPFRGIFPDVEGQSGSVFDASMLFGIFMYGLFAMGMHAAVGWIDRKIAAARAAEMWGSSQAVSTAAVPPAPERTVQIPPAVPPAGTPSGPAGGSGSGWAG